MTGTFFNLPDLGEGLTEAEIVQWHVSEGEHVTEGQPLVSVETDKAVVEVPSPESGIVAKLHASSGERVAVGAALVEFTGVPREDRGTVVGALEGPATEHPSSAPEAKPEPATVVKVSPAVRKLAHERGIALSSIVPSGPGGSISRADVLKATRKTETKGEPLRGVRRAMAERMGKAHAAVAAATVTGRADIDRWAASQDLVPRLVRAVVAACRAAPALNAWYRPQEEVRELHDSVDLGIAVDSENGLFAPVLRDAQAKNPEALAAELEGLIEAVNNRTIQPAAMRGASITLSNFGAIGGLFASMIVVPPQVAIVGAGRASPELIVTPEGSAPHILLPLSVTFDHRVVTGGEAARFLQALIDDLEKQD